MLTKNFYSYMVAKLSDLKTPCTYIDGAQGEINGGSAGTKVFAAMLKQSINSENDKGGVLFGAGTAPATVQDYKLDAPITTGLSIIIPNNFTYAKGNSFQDVAVTYGVTNTSSSEITISEIGLVATIYVSGNLYESILVDRTVLDTPVTIPAGESKQITYTFRFNYGDAV